MKTSKIVIKNLFGIRETTLDGKSVEISGPKGAGKTSVLDAIRFALTNRSERDCIVHQGADEGEIIIETTTGLSIDRKALPAKSAGTVKVRDGSLLQTRPAEFLSQIFTPLQLNPVEFTQLSRQEKNRVILSLIEFDWDVNWIREQFGEIPQGVDYSKHILEVLNDIQAENGVYFQSRQNINRDIRNKQAFISDIAKDIPSGYDYDRWNQYPIGERYRELERLREKNSVIERAKAFRANFTSKLRGLEGSRDVEIGAIDRDIAAERAALTGSIERMKAELQATEEKLAQLSRRRQDRVDIATANFEAAKAKLEKDVGVAEQYADQEPVDTTALAAEVTNAEEMRKHLNEYQRMVAMQAEVQDLTDQSAELTRKIELARELPATILAEAHIPVEGLTVENGIPLINGLPISNLSDGELLELCVDISVCKPGQLEIILIDGAERLDKESRERLYAKCKAKLFGDAKASTLVGKQIQLYVDHNVRDPQDGGMTDGIRIRPYKPRVQKQEPVPPCTDCGNPIEAAMGKNAHWLAAYTTKNYGVPLCAACAQKRKEAAAAAEMQQETENAAEVQQDSSPENFTVDPDTGEVL